MSYSKPFHRNYRAMVAGPNSGYSQWAFVVDKAYAKSPEHYVRAFLLIQNDLQRLFEFVEPSDLNLQTHSFRIHELFMRTCIEVEANFKAILKENSFNPTDRRGRPRLEKDWNIHDYRKVNKTHRLSSYKVHFPIWDGAQSVFEPFKMWAGSTELPWYQAYNKSKHDRHIQFREANLNNLLGSICGLLVILSSQFGAYDFSPQETVLSCEVGDDYYSGEAALGGFFRIEFPTDWEEAEKYEFDWSSLKEEAHKFAKLNYDLV